MWKLKNTLLNNPWIKEEIRGEIRKYFEMNENKTTTHQNLWDEAKSVHRVKFINVNTYVKRRNISTN